MTRELGIGREQHLLTDLLCQTDHFLENMFHRVLTVYAVGEFYK